MYSQSWDTFKTFKEKWLSRSELFIVTLMFAISPSFGHCGMWSACALLLADNVRTLTPVWLPSYSTTNPDVCNRLLLWNKINKSLTWFNAGRQIWITLQSTTNPILVGLMGLRLDFVREYITHSSGKQVERHDGLFVLSDNEFHIFSRLWGAECGPDLSSLMHSGVVVSLRSNACLE